MADEITVSALLEFSKGGLEVKLNSGVLRLDVSGTKFIHNVQNVGFAAAEALDLGDMTSPGMCLMINRDTTNYVSVRAGAAGANTVQILAGEAALFRHASATPFVQADTAAVNIEYVLIEA